MTSKQKQCLLYYLGFYSGAIDGIFGPASEAATRAFQSAWGLPVDGIFGAQTEAAARAAVADPDSFWTTVRYFKKDEFRCRCGSCGGFPAQPRQVLVTLADKVREHFGAACHISSGVRCESHNKAVGGVRNSRHLLGKAMDFRTEGVAAKDVLTFLDTLPEVRYCYAIDANFVHMDIA